MKSVIGSSSETVTTTGIESSLLDVYLPVLSPCMNITPMMNELFAHIEIPAKSARIVKIENVLQ